MTPYLVDLHPQNDLLGKYSKYHPILCASFMISHLYSCFSSPSLQTGDVRVSSLSFKRVGLMGCLYLQTLMAASLAKFACACVFCAIPFKRRENSFTANSISVTMASQLILNLQDAANGDSLQASVVPLIDMQLEFAPIGRNDLGRVDSAYV
jgi:hypothetical protein